MTISEPENRTPVSCVTGRDTDHYTSSERLPEVPVQGSSLKRQPKRPPDALFSRFKEVKKLYLPESFINSK